MTSGRSRSGVGAPGSGRFRPQPRTLNPEPRFMLLEALNTAPFFWRNERIIVMEVVDENSLD